MPPALLKEALSGSTVKFVRLVQPENAFVLMEVTELGILTLVRPVDPENASVPIEVTGRLLILAGMTKAPDAWGLLPVMVMLLALVV